MNKIQLFICTFMFIVIFVICNQFFTVVVVLKKSTYETANVGKCNFESRNLENEMPNVLYDCALLQ